MTSPILWTNYHLPERDLDLKNRSHFDMHQHFDPRATLTRSKKRSCAHLFMYGTRLSREPSFPKWRRAKPRTLFSNFQIVVCSFGPIVSRLILTSSHASQSSTASISTSSHQPRPIEEPSQNTNTVEKTTSQPQSFPFSTPSNNHAQESTT